MHQNNAQSKGRKALYTIASVLCFVIAAFFFLIAVFGLQVSIAGALFCLLVTLGLVYLGLKLQRAAKNGKPIIDKSKSPAAEYVNTKARYSTPKQAKAANVIRQGPPVVDATPTSQSQQRIGSVINIEKINIHDDKTIMALCDYLVLDVETTGLNQITDRIVEISVIKVTGNEVTEEFSTLVNPEMPISPKASAVNGIFDSDVADAPKYKDIAEDVAALLSDSVVIGHNVTFDLNFVKRLLGPLGIKTTIYYLDTMYYGRRLVPGLDSYKLQTLLSHFSIDPGSAHRASSDAAATLQLFLRLRDEYAAQKKAEATRKKAEREREKQERREKYHDSPLLEKTFVFTGEFDCGREKAEALIASVGGLLRQSVTSKTNYLIIGDVSDLPQWVLERKYEKAQGLLADGQDIQILDENDFRSLIKEAKAQIVAASR